MAAATLMFRLPQRSSPIAIPRESAFSLSSTIEGVWGLRSHSRPQPMACDVPSRVSDTRPGQLPRCLVHLCARPGRTFFAIVPDPLPPAIVASVSPTAVSSAQQPEATEQIAEAPNCAFSLEVPAGGVQDRSCGDIYRIPNRSTSNQKAELDLRRIGARTVYGDRVFRTSSKIYTFWRNMSISTVMVIASHHSSRHCY